MFVRAYVYIYGSLIRPVYPSPSPMHSEPWPWRWILRYRVAAAAAPPLSPRCNWRMGGRGAERPAACVVARALRRQMCIQLARYARRSVTMSCEFVHPGIRGPDALRVTRARALWRTHTSAYFCVHIQCSRDGCGGTAHRRHRAPAIFQCVNVDRSASGFGSPVVVVV